MLSLSINGFGCTLDDFFLNMKRLSVERNVMRIYEKINNFLLTKKEGYHSIKTGLDLNYSCVGKRS